MNLLAVLLLSIIPPQCEDPHTWVWFPVQGADRYVICVGSDPRDFQYDPETFGDDCVDVGPLTFANICDPPGNAFFSVVSYNDGGTGGWLP